MRALIPLHHSRAIARIGDALAQYAPCEVARIPGMRKDTPRSWMVPGEESGDVVVMLVNGLHDHFMAQAERCLARGQKYAVVQIALRTTRHPDTNQWRQLWSKASAVWTYYPLKAWIQADGGSSINFPFYHAPLGVDASIFTLGSNAPRPFMICTSGFRRNQEGVAECDSAAYSLGGKVFQLGPEFRMRSETTFLTGIQDIALAAMYRQTQFVSGLRRHEGFELPAAEGLLCGARPVLFDRDHYRAWYDEFGDFVNEGSAEEVTTDLIKLFRRGPHQVSVEERAVAVRRFDWETIVRGFWECLSGTSARRTGA